MKLRILKNKNLCLLILLLILSPCFKAEAYRAFATREGMVGGITANGHKIKVDDWFVALPRGTRLAPNNSFGTPSQRVRVTYGQRSVIAPIWDVAYSGENGHLIRTKVDTDSGLKWTLVGA